MAYLPPEDGARRDSGHRPDGTNLADGRHGRHGPRARGLIESINARPFPIGFTIAPGDLEKLTAGLTEGHPAGATAA